MEEIYNAIRQLARDKDNVTPVNMDELTGKLSVKMGLLFLEMQQYDNNLTTNRENIRIEAGNIMVLLIELMEKYGICYNSFEDAIRIQHLIEIKRIDNPGRKVQ